MLKRTLFLGALLAAVLGTTGTASAQSAAGARLGYDTEFNALILGGEVRFPVNRIEDFPLVGNPSFEYYLIDQFPAVNETLAEINANAYYEFELEDREDIVPYAGAGLGLRYYSVDAGHLRLSLGGGSSTVGLSAGLLFEL